MKARHDCLKESSHKSNSKDKVETICYSESLEKLRDMQASLDYIRDQTEREMMKKYRKIYDKEYAKGYEEGLEIGRNSQRKDIIRKMLSFDITPEKIVSIFGLTVNEVLRLAEED